MGYVQSISSGHFSHDLQVKDALDYLEANYPAAYEKVIANFPEAKNIVWQQGGAWFDTSKMSVDIEFSSWLCDAIEETGYVNWEEGEPWTTDVV